LKKCNKSTIINGEHLAEERLDVEPTVTAKKIYEKIKEKCQDFLTSYKEFNPELQENEGQVLHEEFETLTGFNNLKIELKSMFDRASNFL